MNSGSDADPGIILGVSQPRRGERAARIRQLRDRYPEMSQAAIARRVGCSEQNVSGVLAAYLEDTGLDAVAEFRADKATICESIQHRLLASITQEKLDKTPAVSLITGFAILEDKIRVMQGLPTSIHVNALMDVAAMLREKRDRGELTRQQLEVSAESNATGSDDDGQ